MEINNKTNKFCQSQQVIGKTKLAQAKEFAIVELGNNIWLNGSSKSWPSECSISGCRNTPTLGAHVINSNVSGERIIPACDSCNKLGDKFNLKVGVTLVSANKSTTCAQ